MKLTREGSSEASLAEFFFEFAQLLQSVLAGALLFSRRAGRGQDGWGFWARRFGTEANAADVEVFLETIQLEEIGQFERTDIATGVTDFFLQVTHDLDQVGESKTGAVELKPEALPVKTQ